MDDVQIFCRAAAVRLAVAGLPPWQQRCCDAVCTCTITEVEVRVICREALSVTSHPYSIGDNRARFSPSGCQSLTLPVWTCKGMGHICHSDRLPQSSAEFPCN